MAKRMVKCLYCGEMFDANAEPYVKPRANRYAHQHCAEKHEKNITQEEKDEEELYEYIKHLFGKNYNYMKIKKQVESFRKMGYSYNGIKLSLKWFYEIKGNSLENANGGIGIVPYVFNDAKQYYYNLYLAKLANADVNNYKPRVIEIFVPVPVVHRRPPRLFNLEGDSFNE